MRKDTEYPVHGTTAYYNLPHNDHSICESTICLPVSSNRLLVVQLRVKAPKAMKLPSSIGLAPAPDQVDMTLFRPLAWITTRGKKFECQLYEDTHTWCVDSIEEAIHGIWMQWVCMNTGIGPDSNITPRLHVV